MDDVLTAVNTERYQTTSQPTSYKKEDACNKPSQRPCLIHCGGGHSNMAVRARGLARELPHAVVDRGGDDDSGWLSVDGMSCRGGRGLPRCIYIRSRLCGGSI